MKKIFHVFLGSFGDENAIYEKHNEQAHSNKYIQEMPPEAFLYHKFIFYKAIS